MKRALAATALSILTGCAIVDAGESREAEYYQQVVDLQQKLDDQSAELEKTKTRVTELESDEHARFIDAYLQGQTGTPDQGLAAWDAFLQDFPQSPLAAPARELRDRNRARALELEVIEADEYRALLDKLKTAEPAQRSVLIDDFLTRYPNSTRRADLEKRLKTQGDIDALRNRFSPPTDAPPAPSGSPERAPEPSGSGATSGRVRVDVPLTKPAP